MVKAIVRSVISTTKEGLPLVKKRKDGTFSRYDLVSCELTEGALTGSAVWGQRTLHNEHGVDKDAVAEGQEVTLSGHIENGKPFWTVMVGAPIASDADVLAAYFSGVTTGATVPTVGVKEPF